MAGGYDVRQSRLEAANRAAELLIGCSPLSSRCLARTKPTQRSIDRSKHRGVAGPFAQPALYVQQKVRPKRRRYTRSRIG